MDSGDVINRLCLTNKSHSYLEIGICRGTTFRQVNITDKTGVDPYPKLSDVELAKMRIEILTSDEFFSRNNRKFDFIFLDGLHTSDQTAEDFVNSIQCSNKKTIWLIDDVFPDSNAASARSLKKYRMARFFEVLMNRNNTPVGWQGDVFRMIEKISILKGYFTYSTICEPGFRMQTVVAWNSARFQNRNFDEVRDDLSKNLDLFLSNVKSSIEIGVPSIFKTQPYLGRKSNKFGQPTDVRTVPDWYCAQNFNQIESDLKSKMDDF